MEVKYSSVKSSVFGAAQEPMGQSRLKLLKAAPNKIRLFHGEAAKALGF